MPQLKQVVRARIEALADYVEEHNEGALRGSTEAGFFSQAQAETYLRFYNGHKREVQEHAIESQLIPPEDPLYGWGWLAQHEPTVRLVGASRQHTIEANNDEFKKQALAQKRRQPAELLVIKRPQIVATLPMYILYATVEPIIIPDIPIQTIISRISRVKGQVRSPGLLEKLCRLHCQVTPSGVKLSTVVKDIYTIGPIDKNG